MQLYKNTHFLINPIQELSPILVSIIISHLDFGWGFSFIVLLKITKQKQTLIMVCLIQYFLF